ERRGAGYRFQMRVPADLRSAYGASPIRIRLGSVGATSPAWPF
ncbi:DUF6538 domain-containing protein, partial [Xanthobacter sediminis]